MKSLRSLFRIGLGPSSSHTMGPNRAAKIFAERCNNVDSYRVTLYGSLAATGKGHMTDQAIINAMKPTAPAEIIWKPDTVLPRHTNGMFFEALVGDEVIASWHAYSIGGGTIVDDGTSINLREDVYPMSNIADILAWCVENGRDYWEYVDECEGPEIWDHLREVWHTMCDAIERGLNNEGVLPGGLGV